MERIEVLLPQDIVVALKLITTPPVPPTRTQSAHPRPQQRPSYAALAASLGLSPSQTYQSVKRLQRARLLSGPELGDRPILAALKEFLIHGVKYAFPAQRGRLMRGTPTAHAAPPLNALIQPDADPIPVWPSPKGTAKGESLLPLHPSAPLAAANDPALYELLALLDAIRDGRARERKLAAVELSKRLRRK